MIARARAEPLRAVRYAPFCAPVIGALALALLSNGCGGTTSGTSSEPPSGVTMHGVTLKWDASTSSDVIGYFVYRSPQSGGPYKVLNDAPVTATTFQDEAPGGQHWYWVVTAVDANFVESFPSAEAEAEVPR